MRFATKLVPSEILCNTLYTLINWKIKRLLQMKLQYSIRFCDVPLPRITAVNGKRRRKFAESSHLEAGKVESKFYLVGAAA